MQSFPTDRAKHLYMARIFIAQARATSIPSRAAKYLDWAAARRRMAQGIEPEREPSPRGWYLTPGGVIVMCHASGYHGVQCFSTPVEHAHLRTKEERRQCHPWIFREFTIRQGKFLRFLSRCQFLGTEIPTAAINEQVERFALLNQTPAVVSAPIEAPKAVIQMELFA